MVSHAQVMNLKHDFRRPSNSYKDTFILGTAYWNNEKYKHESLVKSIEDVKSIRGLKEILNSISGFFAVVTIISDDLVLAVDPIQGIPLYYYKENNYIYVSDSEERIIQRIGETTYDPVSVAEYRTATYVTGTHTLLNELHQVEAGTIAILTENSSDFYEYYTYDYSNQRYISEKDLDSVLQTVIDRLIRYANDRPIWIPLSAGYDSRLLLTKLVESGYENLNTFSYGQANNYEATKSEAVAESLNTEWYFVEYTRERWKQWFSSADRKRVDAAMELTTVPPLREWAAVKSLLESGVMDRDSVLVPGHSADFLAGSHIPVSWINQDKVSKQEFLGKVLSDHYKYNELTNEEVPEVQKRITEAANFSGGNGISAIEAYEKWDWRARQSRQITAHVWSEELLGVDWWMPYWDKEFIDFWLSVHLSQRKKRRYYNNYVWNKYRKKTSSPVLPEGFEDNVWGKLKYKIKRSRIGPLATKAYNKLLDNNESDGRLSSDETGTKQSPEKAYEHPIGNIKMMKFKTFKEVYNGDRNARSYRARERLGEINFG